MKKITVTEQDLAKAFTEWDRRFRENPASFMSQAENLLKQTAETYGDAATPYFVQLITEVQGQ